MKVVFEITGLSCDLALHPISPQTAESMREGGRDIYSQKYMNWWRRGNTRTFGMRLNESSEIRLQVDGEDVSFNANLLYRNVYTLRQRMYLSSKAQFLAVLGYDNETCTFRWIWENIDHFDASKFNFVVTDWDNVLGTKGYRVLDNVFYNDKHADDEESTLRTSAARSKKNLREPPTTAGKMCAGKTFSRHLELGSLRFAGAFFMAGGKEGAIRRHAERSAD